MWSAGEVLHVDIQNPAPSPQVAALSLQTGTGHAQKSIAYRLAYKFNARASLKGSWQGGMYRCEIAVPLD